MSINLITFSGSNVLPEYDASLYNAIGGLDGIISGCEVTIVNNGLHIAAGDGILAGRYFTIEEEQLSVTLPASGTVASALYVHMDLSDADNPIELVAGAVPTYEYDRANGVFDLVLCNYTAAPGGPTSLDSVAPKAVNGLILQRNTAYSVGDVVFVPSSKKKYAYVCRTAGTTAAVEPYVYRGDYDPYTDMLADGTAEFSQFSLVPKTRSYSGNYSAHTESSDTHTLVSGLPAGRYLVSVHCHILTVEGVAAFGTVKIGNTAVATQSVIGSASGTGDMQVTCIVKNGSSANLTFTVTSEYADITADYRAEEF